VAVERYLAALEREAARRAPAADHVEFSSVFFGGGTPSALGTRHFERVMRAVRGHFRVARDAEITLEANPESVRDTLLEAWSAGGVNRLSMGAQSFDAIELEGLGRIHGPERPREAFALARHHGFRRLSLDLMFGFPGHRMDTWRATVESALALEPEHLSAYCFIPEAETPLGAAVLSGREAPVGGDQQADLYDALTERVAAAECRHNLVYWLRRDYLALGPSAHGLWRGVRYANQRELSAWAQRLEQGLACDDAEPGSETSRLEEIVMLGLRLGTGVRREDHPDDWASVMERFGAAVEWAARLGRLEGSASGFRIARRHRFVADDVIAWLLAAAEPGARPGPIPIQDTPVMASLPVSRRAAVS
jgi:oxygen-independent coproporphyrinogen-3 oxidase